MSWVFIILPVEWMITLEKLLSLACRMLFFFLVEDLANWVILWPFSWRNLALAFQPSQFSIQQSRMILWSEDCTMMLFLRSLFILIPCETFHVLGAILWAIKCVPVYCHQLGRLTCNVYLSWWWTYCSNFPVPIHWSQWCHKDWYHCWCYDKRCKSCQSMHSLWMSGKFHHQ